MEALTIELTNILMHSIWSISYLHWSHAVHASIESIDSQLWNTMPNSQLIFSALCAIKYCMIKLCLKDTQLFVRSSRMKSKITRRHSAPISRLNNTLLCFHAYACTMYICDTKQNYVSILVNPISSNRFNRLWFQIYW